MSDGTQHTMKVRTRIYNWFWFNRRLTRCTIRFLMKRMMLGSVEDTILYLKLHEWQNVHDYEAPSATTEPRKLSAKVLAEWKRERTIGLLPAAQEALVDYIEAVERERDKYKDDLDICEFCEDSISAGEGTFNVCGRCYNKTVNDLRAQLAEVTREREQIYEQLSAADRSHEATVDARIKADEQNRELRESTHPQ